jgi:hypothetical protein
MRFVCSFLLLIVIAVITGCGRSKPAYSDINTNQAGRSENQNGGQQAAAPADAGGGQGKPSDAQPQPAPPQPDKFRIPAFMDQATGEIKDLPNYPRAVRRNIQYGPNQGLDTMSLLLETGDGMDKIAEFYEKAIKSNGWTVSDKVRDPEISQWTLKKGKDDEAKIEVKKDPRSKSMYIAVARTQAQPKQ